MFSDKILKEIDFVTSSFQHELGTLTNEGLNWKPSKSSWSIGQIIDHLIRTNESYFPGIYAPQNGTHKTHFIGRIGFIADFIGKLILKAVSPDRKKAIKTFQIWEPTSSQVSDDILNRFLEQQKKLKILVSSCENLLIQEAVISSPANSHIVYRLKTAFEIIISHELRHLEQAKHLVQELKKFHNETT